MRTPQPAHIIKGTVLGKSTREWEAGRSEDGRRSWDAGKLTELAIVLEDGAVDGEMVNLPSYLNLRVPNDSKWADFRKEDAIEVYAIARVTTDWVRGRPINSVTYYCVSDVSAAVDSPAGTRVLAGV